MKFTGTRDAVANVRRTRAHNTRFIYPVYLHNATMPDASASAPALASASAYSFVDAFRTMHGHQSLDLSFLLLFVYMEFVITNTQLYCFCIYVELIGSWR